MEAPKSMLTATERMQMILSAPPATLVRIDAILQGTDTLTPQPDEDCRLVTFTAAAKRMGVSRPTVYRLARAGRLEVVPLNGVNRIRLQSVIDCVTKGVK